MAFFNLGTSTSTAMTFNSVNLTCLQTIEVSGTAPVTEIECAGSTSVTNIVGIPRYTMTVTGAWDSAGNALATSLKPGETGAITCDPAGTTAPAVDISSTNATVSDFSLSMPVNGFSTYSATFQLDDLTIGANA